MPKLQRALRCLVASKCWRNKLGQEPSHQHLLLYIQLHQLCSACSPDCPAARLFEISCSTVVLLGGSSGRSAGSMKLQRLVSERTSATQMARSFLDVQWAASSQCMEEHTHLKRRG